jgi:hypothetical protein
MRETQARTVFSLLNQWTKQKRRAALTFRTGHWALVTATQGPISELR